MKKPTTTLISILILTILAVAVFWIASGSKQLCEDGSPKYTLKNTDLEFCYSDKWGEPIKKDAEAKAGKYFTVEFPNSDGLVVKFQSYDFEPTEKGPEKFNFNDLRMTAPDEDLKKQLMEQLKLKENELKVSKSDIDGTRALRAHLTYTDANSNKIDTINYYIQNAIPDYSIILSANFSMAEEVDEMIYDMKL